MQASTLTIADSTKLDGKLTRAKRKLLREKLVKEYIRSRPYGVAIQLKEFQKLLRYGSTGEARVLLREMLESGQILREEIPGKRSFSYTVAGVTVVTKPKDKDVISQVIDQAKNYAWEENSDSLRGFIEYIRQKGTL